MVQDLSQHHQPISDVFPKPEKAEDWEQYRLSDEQVEFFRTNGYLAGVRILSEAQADTLCEQLAELTDPNHPANSLFYEFHTNESPDPSRVLFHALGAWRIAPAFHDLLWHPAFLVPASQLLEGAVRFWHDQLFCKPPHHGGVVAWHQDYSYWTRTKPMAHLTCWMGLDESKRDNGCLHYVPRSHEWDLLPITGLAGDMDAIREVLPDDHKDDFKPVAIELARGEASFHHPLMIHGSFENSTERPRRAVVINAFRDGVHSATDEVLLDGVPVISNGKKMEGQFFPLLYEGL